MIFNQTCNKPDKRPTQGDVGLLRSGDDGQNDRRSSHSIDAALNAATSPLINSLPRLTPMRGCSRNLVGGVDLPRWTLRHQYDQTQI